MGSSKDSRTRIGVLSILVIQNCSLILIMRYSRIVGDNSSSRYIISTAVLLSEAIKFVISFSVVYGNRFNLLCSPNRMLTIFLNDFYENRFEILKLCIPSGLYVIQNNLQYLSASNLPVAMFQVLSQLKIVTTAFFSVFMLGKKLSIVQWMSVLALTCGVATVQFSQQRSNLTLDEHYLFGVLCTLISCLTSGFSGVYFEKVLKAGSLTLWMRNCHLSLIGFTLAAVSTSFFFFVTV
jgi:solute carrier family 35 (UDP-sugar transporter), member A1/2/3